MFGCTAHGGKEGQPFLFGGTGYPEAGNYITGGLSPTRAPRAVPFKESLICGRTWQEAAIDRIPSPVRFRARSSDASQYHDATVRVFRGRSVGAEVSAFAKDRLTLQAPPSATEGGGGIASGTASPLSSSVRFARAPNAKGPHYGPAASPDGPLSRAGASPGASPASTLRFSPSRTGVSPTAPLSGYPASTILPPQHRGLVVLNKAAFHKP